ncbi:unnamed protein product, partial [Brassica rapa]
KAIRGLSFRDWVVHNRLCSYHTPFEATIWERRVTFSSYLLLNQRQLRGLRMRRLLCTAALFGSVAVVKARLSPENSTDNRVDVLLSVMGDFGYSHLLSQNWNGSEPCEWYGIHCMDGQIRGITLSFMNLTGSISKRFADLTSLYSLDLSYNKLTGTIPLELTRMKLIRSLDLSYNQLHGKVPHFKTLIPDTSGNPEILRDAPSRGGNHILAWVLPVGIGSIGILIGAGICFFRAWKRNRSGRASQPAENEMVPQSQQNEILESGNNAFSLEILREATQDFSFSVGTGGSGSVYQGK